MTQTIKTRYRGPTNTRPSCIIATTSGGKSKRFSYDYEANADGNHRKAAQGLAASLGWRGQYQGGALDDKGGMVWVCTCDAFAQDYRFYVEQTL